MQRLLRVVPDEPFKEDQVTLQMMEQYGVDNVRGGTYCQMELSAEQKARVQRQIWGDTDCCTRCGRSGHYVGSCYATATIHGIQLTQEEAADAAMDARPGEKRSRGERSQAEAAAAAAAAASISPAREMPAARGSSSTCSRCGRNSHQVSRCYAKTDVEGRPLGAGRSPTREMPAARGSSNTCSRCGRDGHQVSRCYAKTDVERRRFSSSSSSSSSSSCSSFSSFSSGSW